MGDWATTAIAFAREGAKVVLVYKKVDRPFDATKMELTGTMEQMQEMQTL